LFLNKNGLNPLKFVSLRNIEIELIEITKRLWHADSDAVGNFTSGGTESLILAVKAYRDFARTRLP
jgi:glutamate/tyrosine decarboxylase-like PLP-dependent enzyme